jgi:hypothetical protein
MDLPFVIDVAIGLVFIYLILSLLASEFQELLTTLLQWRAKHLRDSIEVFLAGGVDGQQEAVKDLVAKLYDDPLIKNVNQEAKGIIARAVRRLTRWIPSNRKGAFGTNQSSGPSYIASETFATSLLERLGLADLTTTLTQVRLEKFATRIIGEYNKETLQPYTDADFAGKSGWQKGRLRLLAQEVGAMNLDQDLEFQSLVAEYDDILHDFKVGEADLDTCVVRMGERLSDFIVNYVPILSVPTPSTNPAPAPAPDSGQTGQGAGEDFSAAGNQSTTPDTGETYYPEGMGTAGVTPDTGETYYPEGMGTAGTGENYYTEGAGAVPDTGEAYYPEGLGTGAAPDTGEAYSPEGVSTGAGTGETYYPEDMGIGAAPDSGEIYYPEGMDVPGSSGTGEGMAQASDDTPPPTDAGSAAGNSFQSARTQNPMYLNRRLQAFKNSLFGEKFERAVLSGGLRPSLVEIAQLVNEGSGVYREVAGAYRSITTDGKQFEKRVNAELETRLVNEQPEVVAQQLAERYPDAIAIQFEEHYRKVFREIKKPLDSSRERIRQAELANPNALGQQRRHATKPRWTTKLWQWLTNSDLDGLKQQQQRILNRGFDKLVTVQLRDLITGILHSLNPEERCDTITDALNQLSPESQDLLINRILANLVETGEWTDEQCTIYRKYQTYKTAHALLDKLPRSVKESFEILARRSQTKLEQTTTAVEQFRGEVAVWFDRSMSRASGVYKRNAKGVAILIGLIIASSTNTDTFYIIGRLASDPDLRRVITEQAVNLRPVPGAAPATTPSPGAAASPNPATSPDDIQNQLELIKAQTDQALQGLTLPIGWNAVNLSQQLSCPGSSSSDDPTNWTVFFDKCLPPTSQQLAQPPNLLQNVAQVGVQNWRSLPKLLLGWLVSGIAIAMGAPFWFDLLNKVVNVRNSGGKPPVAATQDSTSK